MGFDRARTLLWRWGIHIHTEMGRGYRRITLGLKNEETTLWPHCRMPSVVLIHVCNHYIIVCWLLSTMVKAVSSL